MVIFSRKAFTLWRENLLKNHFPWWGCQSSPLSSWCWEPGFHGSFGQKPHSYGLRANISRRLRIYDELQNFLQSQQSFRSAAKRQWLPEPWRFLILHYAVYVKWPESFTCVYERLSWPANTRIRLSISTGPAIVERVFFRASGAPWTTLVSQYR